MTEVDVNQSDDGRRVAARTGDVVVIRLPENAATGYQWELDPGPAAEVVDDGSELPDSDAAGATGLRLFRVAVPSPGSVRLAAKRWRPWEGESSVVERFSVDLDVS